MNMAKKPKAPTTEPKHQLRVNEADFPDKSRECVMALVAQSSITANAQTARTFARGTFGETDLTESVNLLRDKVAKVQTGDLSVTDEMLMSQATALDSIFTELARRAALNMGEYINAAETYMRLALKAQSQCRATLETLGLIKNPPNLAFVKQANIAHGPQQVNNATAPAGNPSRVRETENLQSKLLEAQDGKRLDTGTTQAAVSGDTAMATVGKINGPKNGKRKS